LPQIQSKRIFDEELFTDGLRQILWGLFAKLVIADGCAPYVDKIFNQSAEFSGSTLLIGSILFAIQIYADFSGYSDMAIGSAKLLGFRLMQNFAYPYFATNIGDFWRRWHISLTSWFRDYIFLPLAYFISGKIRRQYVFFIKSDFVIYVTAITITWFLTGFWHGAMFTFIAWGLIHAMALIIHQAFRKTRRKLLHTYNFSGDSLLTASTRLFTLFIVLISWIFFRSESVHSAFGYLDNMFSLTLFDKPKVIPLEMILPVLFYFGIEWVQRAKNHGLAMTTPGKPAIFRWGFYYLILLLIFFYANPRQEFIYFQF
jgi:alginate O-acetyltransferase complex protein AlgI